MTSKKKFRAKNRRLKHTNRLLEGTIQGLLAHIDTLYAQLHQERP